MFTLLVLFSIVLVALVGGVGLGLWLRRYKLAETQKWLASQERVAQTLGLAFDRSSGCCRARSTERTW